MTKTSDTTRASLPVKRTLNLRVQEKRFSHPERWIPLIVVILILAVLIGKFGVADRFAKVSAARAELNAAKRNLESIRASYSDFRDVQKEYNRYTYEGYDLTIADRLDVMSILERKVLPVCSVRSFSVTGKTVSISVAGLTFRQISDLTADLMSEPLVNYVYVSSASHNDGNYVDLENAAPDDVISMAQMTITLNDADSIEEGK